MRRHQQQQQQKQYRPVGIQPATGRSEQWTVDLFWKMDRPPPQSIAEESPGLSSTMVDFNQHEPLPREEGVIDSEAEQDTSVLEVPAVNCANAVKEIE